MSVTTAPSVALPQHNTVYLNAANRYDGNTRKGHQIMQARLLAIHGLTDAVQAPLKAVADLKTALAPIGRAARVTLLLWLGSMVLLPISQWTLGTTVANSLLQLSVIAQTATILLILATTWTRRRVFATALAVAATTLTVEACGASTGFPFGAYHYTDVLQPQVVGVPLLIPLAWFMMLPPAWAVARCLTRTRTGFALVSGVAFTASRTLCWTLRWWRGIYGGGPHPGVTSASRGKILSVGSPRRPPCPSR